MRNGPRSPIMAPMSLDPDHPDAWKVRSRWIGVLILLALFVFLASRFLPQVHGNERAFVAGESQALQGTLLDPGLRRRYNQKDWTVRMQQFFDYHLKGAPKPAWMEKGVPYVEREEEKTGFQKLYEPAPAVQ